MQYKWNEKLILSISYMTWKSNKNNVLFKNRHKLIKLKSNLHCVCSKITISLISVDNYHHFRYICIAEIIQYSYRRGNKFFLSNFHILKIQSILNRIWNVEMYFNMYWVTECYLHISIRNCINSCSIPYYSLFLFIYLFVLILNFIVHFHRVWNFPSHFQNSNPLADFPILAQWYSPS